MEKDTFQGYRKWFIDYVGSFYSEDPLVLQNIKLKEEHSLRVCNNAHLISMSENMDEDNCYLAMTIALFHDIGRFQQFFKYRTFKDSASENHALLGIRILESEGVLSILPKEQKEMIYQAIENHNMYRIPDGIGSECLFHSRLVRDADKLDIFRVLTEYYAERDFSPNPALEMGLPDIPEYSHQIVEDIFNNRLASTAYVRTCNDMRLARLSWVFDLNFTETFCLVRKQGYIDTIVSKLPQDDRMAALNAHIESYMDSVLMSGCDCKG